MTATALPDIVIDGETYPDRGYCYRKNEWAPMVHTKWCTLGDGWGDTAVTSSSCIRHGQDGKAIAKKRHAEMDRRRFTPPEYRTRPRGPEPIIDFDRRQPLEVLALRGRARGTDEWSTWETYVEADHTTLASSLKTLTSRSSPREMSVDEAAEIVAEFARRCPAYEFKIVRARVTVVEELVAD